MKYICNKCNEEGPCIISVGGDFDPPEFCPFGYDDCNAEWEEIESPGKIIWYEESCFKDDGERQAATPEPISKPGVDDVLPEVIKDLQARDVVGVKKYGTTLQTHNGRDSLNDLYQEILDAAMYVKQTIMERKQQPAPGQLWEGKIRQWANDRGLYEAVTLFSQVKKMLEEALEWHEAAQRYDRNPTEENKTAEMLELGDMLVVLTNKAESRGYSLAKCGWMAYEKIKGRTGHIENGSFVKD